MFAKSIKMIATVCLASLSAVVLSSMAALAELAVVNSNQLNVRRGPGTNFARTYTLQRGDRVEITRRQGDWAFIVGDRGGEGWVFARYLTITSSPPTSPPNANQIFRGQGTIDNARYNGAGNAQLVLTSRDKGASFRLSNPSRFDLEYIGTVRSNFEGTVQLQITKFRSSAMGYRTVSASGTCDIQASTGNVRQAFCTVNGAGIDHGRSNFSN